MKREYEQEGEGLSEARVKLVEQLGESEVSRVEVLVDEWIAEIDAAGVKDDEEEGYLVAQDDVLGKGREARLAG